MTGYNVHADALIYAGANFKRVAVDYKGGMPQEGLGKPSSGGGQLDEIMHNTLQMLTLLHGLVADATWQHGAKLQWVAENYQAKEAVMTELLQVAISVVAKPGTVPVPGTAPAPGGGQGH
ncbi:DUF6317 family protein [Actinomadura napierensis]|uniref:Uncharacterized protein n=1 Tax=Actinomadura napierensis TaxID=267854 RepID=A0ABN2ZY48_9ACTN